MTTNQHPPQPEDRPITGVACVSNVIKELWKRASDGLSEPELEWFSNSGEQAEFLLDLLTETTNKLGCLLAADEMTRPYGDQGSVAGLLFFLSECMDSVNALVSVSAAASCKLHRKDFLEEMARIN